MNSEEFLAEIKIINHHLQKISNAIEAGINNNPDYSYLKERMDGVHRTSDHILGQLRGRIKRQKAGKE